MASGASFEGSRVEISTEGTTRLSESKAPLQKDKESPVMQALKTSGDALEEAHQRNPVPISEGHVATPIRTDSSPVRKDSSPRDSPRLRAAFAAAKTQRKSDAIKSPREQQPPNAEQKIHRDSATPDLGVPTFVESRSPKDDSPKLKLKQDSAPKIDDPKQQKELKEFLDKHGCKDEKEFVAKYSDSMMDTPELLQDTAKHSALLMKFLESKDENGKQELMYLLGTINKNDPNKFVELLNNLSSAYSAISNNEKREETRKLDEKKDKMPTDEYTDKLDKITKKAADEKKKVDHLLTLAKVKFAENYINECKSRKSFNYDSFNQLPVSIKSQILTTMKENKDFSILLSSKGSIEQKCEALAKFIEKVKSDSKAVSTDNIEDIDPKFIEENQEMLHQLKPIMKEVLDKAKDDVKESMKIDEKIAELNTKITLASRKKDDTTTQKKDDIPQMEAEIEKLQNQKKLLKLSREMISNCNNIVTDIAGLRAAKEFSSDVEVLKREKTEITTALKEQLNYLCQTQYAHVLTSIIEEFNSEPDPAGLPTDLTEIGQAAARLIYDSSKKILSDAELKTIIKEMVYASQLALDDIDSFVDQIFSAVKDELLNSQVPDKQKNPALKIDKAFQGKIASIVLGYTKIQEQIGALKKTMEKEDKLDAQTVSAIHSYYTEDAIGKKGSQAKVIKKVQETITQKPGPRAQKEAAELIGDMSKAKK